MGNFKEKLKQIKAFAFDVDGVFSCGTIYILNDGEPLRSINIKDGYAVQYAVKKNFPIAIITGGNSQAVKFRFKALGVTDIFLRSVDKKLDFNKFMVKYDLKPEEILYMGDDIPDYEVMKMTGLATCPSDAATEIKSISHYISNIKGGEGCVRDVIEQVLRSQGSWMDKNLYSW